MKNSDKKFNDHEKINYDQWLMNLDTEIREARQYENRLNTVRLQNFQLALLFQFQKDVSYGFRNFKRPPKDFKRFDLLVNTTVKQMMDPGIFSFSKKQESFNPRSSEYKQFLKTAKTILLEPPAHYTCATQITLYMAKDSLVAVLPYREQTDYLYNELAGEEQFSVEERKALESKSPIIFTKENNKTAQVVKKYPERPEKLYITAYKEGDFIIVCCRTNKRVAQVVAFFHLAATEYTLVTSPVIGFSVRQSMFMHDGRGNFNIIKTNENSLCRESIKHKEKIIGYYSIFNIINTLPPKINEIVIDYAVPHPCRK